jgi:hypothetical protein
LPAWGASRILQLRVIAWSFLDVVLNVDHEIDRNYARIARS